MKRLLQILLSITSGILLLILYGKYYELIQPEYQWMVIAAICAVALLVYFILKGERKK